MNQTTVGVNHSKVKAFILNNCKDIPRTQAVAEMIVYIGCELEEQLARKPTIDEIMAAIDELMAERERLIKAAAI